MAGFTTGMIKYKLTYATRSGREVVTLRSEKTNLQAIFRKLVHRLRFDTDLPLRTTCLGLLPRCNVVGVRGDRFSLRSIRLWPLVRIISGVGRIKHLYLEEHGVVKRHNWHPRFIINSVAVLPLRKAQLLMSHNEEVERVTLSVPGQAPRTSVPVFRDWTGVIVRGATDASLSSFIERPVVRVDTCAIDPFVFRGSYTPKFEVRAEIVMTMPREIRWCERTLKSLPFNFHTGTLQSVRSTADSAEIDVTPAYKSCVQYVNQCGVLHEGVEFDIAKVLHGSRTIANVWLPHDVKASGNVLRALAHIFRETRLFSMQSLDVIIS